MQFSDWYLVLFSSAKKKDQKKGVKTTQEALDEAKAAALEKDMEAGDDKGKVRIVDAFYVGRGRRISEVFLYLLVFF